MATVQLNVFLYIAKVTVGMVIVTQYNALLLAVLYMRPS